MLWEGVVQKNNADAEEIYLENMKVALTTMVVLFLIVNLRCNRDCMERMVDFVLVNYGNRVVAFYVVSQHNFRAHFG